MYELNYSLVHFFVVRGSQGVYIVTGDGKKKEVIRLVKRNIQ